MENININEVRSFMKDAIELKCESILFDLDCLIRKINRQKDWFVNEFERKSNCIGYIYR